MKGLSPALSNIHIHKNSVNFKVTHPVVLRAIKNEQTNDRRTQQYFYNIKIVETCSYIVIINLLLYSTVI